MKIGFSAEPALWVALADAVLMLAIGFGLPITADQKTLIDVVLTAVAGVVIRSQVTPVASLTPVVPAAPVVEVKP